MTHNYIIISCKVINIIKKSNFNVCIFIILYCGKENPISPIHKDSTLVCFIKNIKSGEICKFSVHVNNKSVFITAHKEVLSIAITEECCGALARERKHKVGKYVIR